MTDYGDLLLSDLAKYSQSIYYYSNVRFYGNGPYLKNQDNFKSRVGHIL
ncbi:MAG: hypothetical protein F6K54_32710 [Okeania sp. SIO3B5]|nr:hypothetical protein [Okeania sp. SIO3B5]NEO57423.1 hypothetical protein [Okeania sp. SIO3B5]